MEETLKKIIRLLEKTEGLKAYALIGGLAVGGWVTPRATRDIDILAELSETDRSSIEKGILKDLLAAGFSGSLLIGGLDDDIRFCIKAVSMEGVPVDILFASRKWESEIVEEGVRIDLMEGVRLPVIRPEGLIVLKLRAGSFQDLADASKILTESEYDREKLLTLAKRARVDKRLKRLMERLGLDPGTPD